MPPKGGGKGDKAPKDMLPYEVPAVPESLLKRYPERWVQVHYKLLTSSLLDDIVRLPSSASLYQVQDKIIARHGGSISRLMLWKDDIQPKNILRDFSMSLKQVWKLDDATPHSVQHPNTPGGALGRLGAAGSSGSALPSYFTSSDVEDHHVVVCYDYKAVDSDCPLLLRSPRYSAQPGGGGGGGGNANAGTTSGGVAAQTSGIASSTSGPGSATFNNAASFAGSAASGKSRAA